jgi:hypothetical protein
MVVRAFSASASVLKGEPPTFVAAISVSISRAMVRRSTASRLKLRARSGALSAEEHEPDKGQCDRSDTYADDK